MALRIDAKASLEADGSINLAGNRLWLTPAEEAHKPFILSTWYRSANALRQASHPQVSYAVFQKEQPLITEALWNRAFCLRSEEGGEEIHGYIVGLADMKLLHYAYVAPPLRRLGLANVMVEAMFGPSSPISLSHPWPFRMKASWSYNPYRIKEI